MCNNYNPTIAKMFIFMKSSEIQLTDHDNNIAFVYWDGK